MDCSEICPAGLAFQRFHATFPKDFQSIESSTQFALSSGVGQRTVKERRFLIEYSHSHFHLNIAMSIGSGQRTPSLTGDRREDSPFEEIWDKDFCLRGVLKAHEGICERDGIDLIFHGPVQLPLNPAIIGRRLIVRATAPPREGESRGASTGGDHSEASPNHRPDRGGAAAPLLRRGGRGFDRFGRSVISALWRSGGEIEVAARDGGGL
jgi:hypothetical protein